MIENILKFGSYSYKNQDFDNIADVSEFIESQKDLRKYSLTQTETLSEDKYFYGVSKFEGLTDRMRYGDEQITSKYLDKLEALNMDYETKEGISFDVEGFTYDMGAVVSGEPECCLNTGFPDVKPHLNIYIDIGYNGSVSPDTIANRGVAILQLINSLLSLGYILDIWMVHFITTSDGELYSQRIKLSTEYLTISQLAFSGTCEFFRVIAWLLTAIQKHSYSYTGDGKSMPASAVIKDMKNQGLFIPSGYTDERFNCCSQKEAIELVRQIYNDYIKSGVNNESY
jgi:hypothetical protein